MKLKINFNCLADYLFIHDGNWLDFISITIFIKIPFQFGFILVEEIFFLKDSHIEPLKCMEMVELDITFFSPVLSSSRTSSGRGRGGGSRGFFISGEEFVKRRVHLFPGA